MRKRLIKLIAISLPIIAILLIEGALRLFHYGYDASVFIPMPGKSDYLIFNPDASKRYFTDPLIATSGNKEPFLRTKPPGTTRIFVLGESTTIGYPYFHNGSFHRWLQYRLLQTNPEKKVEIINVALTAINSYTVLGFAKEVAKQQPDAVLIYTGHNEYYGALGVGSTNRLNGSPALINTLLWLRQWRLVQLFSRTLSAITRIFTSAPSKAGKTRMELMVADQQIAYGSPLYTRGIRQFRDNMDATLAIFEKKQIPVFLSNLISNLRDQRPLASTTAVHSPDTRADNPDTRTQSSDTTAHGPDSTDAQYIYGLATAAWQRGDYTTAKQDFLLAKDLDALRFRAPETLNEIIDTLCKKYHTNTHLVDTRAAFDSASEHGIPGDKLLLEHVHPNLAGYALMSDVFYHALLDYGILPSPDTNASLTLQKLTTDMPITRVDSLSAAFRIDNLKHNWPFNTTGHDNGPPSRQAYHLTTEESDLAYALAFEHLPWEEAMRQLYDYYSKTEDWTRAAGVMEALCLEHPTETEFLEKTAMLYGKGGSTKKAIQYFRRAFDRQPSFDKARYLFVLCLQSDEPAAAMPYLDYAIANNTAAMPLLPIRAAALNIIRLKTRLTVDSTNHAILDSIATSYEKMGNHVAVLKYRKTESK
jgi:lysophospholipase L1-like esterase